MTLDVGSLFALSVSPWEMIIRGSAMYWFLLILFRVVVRRRVGAVGISDLLLLVIIADAAQNAMAGEYRSVTDGFILVATIVAWNTLVDWLTWRSEFLGRLFEPPPLLLIRSGQVLWRHLRMEFVTEQELKSKLREHGIDDYADVEEAYLEPDGGLGVIRRERGASS
jgi:uncharacterized membrane protein YcaP (DUF421 family)